MLGFVGLEGLSAAVGCARRVHEGCIGAREDDLRNPRPKVDGDVARSRAISCEALRSRWPASADDWARGATRATMDAMGRIQSARSATRRVVVAVRCTVAPQHYKPSLEPQPMGFVEMVRVRRASARAEVPQWLIDTDDRPTACDWAEV